MGRLHHPKFVEAYDTFRTHWQWFTAKRAAGELSIPDTKEAVATARAFVDRWRGQTRDAEMEQGLAQFAVLIGSLERSLEQDALAKWLGVLEKRVDWTKGELLLQTCVQCLELLKVTPEKLLPELLTILGQTPEKPFDAEAFYREAEEDAEQHRAEFEAEWRLFTVDWPERATGEQYERLKAIEQEPLLEWMAETKAQLAALKE